MRRKGLTIVEVITTIIIVGILAAVLVPAVLEWRRAQAAINQLQSAEVKTTTSQPTSAPTTQAEALPD